MRRTNLPTDLQQLIKASRYVVLATVCPDGQPWNTPVAAAFDDQLNLYWGSALDSQHSRNIAANGQVFAVVFGLPLSDLEGHGLYLQMHAESLETAADVKTARRHYDASFFEKHHPGITFLGDCPTRLYRAESLQIWHNTDLIEDGYFVDKRQEVLPS